MYMLLAYMDTGFELISEMANDLWVVEREGLRQWRESTHSYESLQSDSDTSSGSEVLQVNCGGQVT